MPDVLTITPVVSVTAAKRTASSGCHGAKLDPGPEPGAFTCRDCGMPCERVLSAPEEVTFHG